jgi:hypothetical protein
MIAGMNPWNPDEDTRIYIDWENERHDPLSCDEH